MSAHITAEELERIEGVVGGERRLVAYIRHLRALLCASFPDDDFRPDIGDEDIAVEVEAIRAEARTAKEGE
jgi:hypothetical protein